MLELKVLLTVLVSFFIFVAVCFICFWKVIAFVLLSSDLVLELYLPKLSLIMDEVLS